MGSRVTVKLAEVSPVTGGILLEVLTLEDAALPRGRRGGKRGRTAAPQLGRSGARGQERKVPARK
jgi:ribonuclease R